MSILIHGKMPKDGECVVVFAGGVVQKYKAGGIAFFEYQSRTEETVAVQLPPHGRLIDADALENEGADVHQDIEYCGYVEDTIYGFSQEMIENAPTILPAEGGVDNG